MAYIPVIRKLYGLWLTCDQKLLWCYTNYNVNIWWKSSASFWTQYDPVEKKIEKQKHNYEQIDKNYFTKKWQTIFIGRKFVS